jgi:hypothetical protein
MGESRTSTNTHTICRLQVTCLSTKCPCPNAVLKACPYLTHIIRKSLGYNDLGFGVLVTGFGYAFKRSSENTYNKEMH